MEPGRNEIVGSVQSSDGFTPVRLCGSSCPVPDERHREPELIWHRDHVGPLHGESLRVVSRWGMPGPDGGPRYDPAYCLCGHPDHTTCPGWLDTGSACVERPGDDFTWF